MRKSSLRNRRHRNPQGERQQPFFPKSNAGVVQKKEDHLPFFQAKLAIGQPGDKYEQEADAVANQVVNAPASSSQVQLKKISSIQRSMLTENQEEEPIQTQKEEEEPVQMMPSCEKEEKEVQMQVEEEEEPVQTKESREEEEVQMQVAEEEQEEPIQMKEGKEEEKLQMKAEAGNKTTTPQLGSRIESKSGKGKPIPKKHRSQMENAFGTNFGGVNIHTDAESVQMNKQLGAQAFTHGKDVFFNAGKYRPESSDGKRLLAHELTHVVQQNSLQTKRDPFIIARKREGGEKSQSGLNEDQLSCPDSVRLDEIEKNYREMIKSARGRGANVAADNLEYFLSGAGGTKTYSVNWLRGFSAITSAERKNQQRFEKSLEDIAESMRHGDRRTFNDYWDAQLTAGISTELYYASGTSTIRSKGNFSLEKIEDIVRIHGSVEHQWYDPYDWHAGLGAYIPGHGSVSDEDGLLMQSCRGAKPFQMEALWTQNVSGTVNINDFWFNSSSFNWTGP